MACALRVVGGKTQHPERLREQKVSRRLHGCRERIRQKVIRGFQVDERKEIKEANSLVVGKAGIHVEEQLLA